MMGMTTPKGLTELAVRAVEALERIAEATERQADAGTTERLARATRERIANDGSRRRRTGDPADDWDGPTCSTPAHDSQLDQGQPSPFVCEYCERPTSACYTDPCPGREALRNLP